MRLLLLAALALAGCFGSADERSPTQGVGDGRGGDEDNGGAGGAAAECMQASDCAPAGPKCCDCPTHAVPKSDPSYQACANVECPTPSCGSPMEAACQAGACVLVCSPVTCDASCADGYATDDNGCLTCACAARTADDCVADSDCARVRDDCCGCARGGMDTAVPASEVAAHEAGLMCPQNPSCPDVDACAAELAARCIAGACTLVAGALPANACGRPDLPACPTGEVCTLNASAPATMQGVGVCLPAP